MKGFNFCTLQMHITMASNNKSFRTMGNSHRMKRSLKIALLFIVTVCGYTLKGNSGVYIKLSYFGWISDCDYHFLNCFFSFLITEISCLKSAETANWSSLILVRYELRYHRHDVNASSQINMAGFCPGYLNQYCKWASVKKTLTSETTICLF